MTLATVAFLGVSEGFGVGIEEGGKELDGSGGRRGVEKGLDRGC